MNALHLRSDDHRQCRSRSLASRRSAGPDRVDPATRDAAEPVGYRTHRPAGRVRILPRRLRAKPQEVTPHHRAAQESSCIGREARHGVFVPYESCGTVTTTSRPLNGSTPNTEPRPRPPRFIPENRTLDTPQLPGPHRNRHRVSHHNSSRPLPMEAHQY
jgi:hypothetical protein